MGTGTYSWLTFQQARQALAQRLNDPGNVQWADAELGLYINEALTEWQALTGYSRARGTFNLSTGVPFYDLTTLLTGGGGNLLLAMSVTDAQVVTLIEYMLLEPPTIPWTGTTQFTLAELTAALQQTRDNFLVETGSVITHSTVNVPSPPLGRFQIDDHVIDVRRLAWTNPYGPTTPTVTAQIISLQNSISGLQSSLASLGNINSAAATAINAQLTVLEAQLSALLSSLPLVSAGPTPLWVNDEFSGQANLPGWSQNPGIPEAFSILAPPPLQVQLIPPPITNGSCDMLSVNAGAALNPSVGVPLGIPTNFVWGVKWGALANLLSQDGEPRDDFRAGYCRQRYQEACELCRMMPVVVTAALNGVQVFPQSVAELDAYRPTWQNSNGPPDAVACAGQNLVAACPPPDSNGFYSMTLDVVQNAVVPFVNGDYVQIGREFWESILVESEHMALFKSGGSEFGDSIPLHQKFIRDAASCNDRLKASSIYLNAIQRQSEKEKKIRPRRETDVTEATE